MLGITTEPVGKCKDKLGTENCKSWLNVGYCKKYKSIRSGCCKTCNGKLDNLSRNL